MKDLIEKHGGVTKFIRRTRSVIPLRTVENWRAGTKPPKWVRFFIEFFLKNTGK